MWGQLWGQRKVRHDVKGELKRGVERGQLTVIFQILYLRLSYNPATNVPHISNPATHLHVHLDAIYAQ
jgi:hypothetical protein